MNKKLLIISIIVTIICISSLILLKNYNTKPSNNESNNNKENKVIKQDKGENMDEFVSKITININGTNYTATLEDNKTSREFIKKLPLEINMDELNGNEKYYYLNNPLPHNPIQIKKINKGDIMLYGDDCLVLFYETFDTSYSYTKIGKIDNPDSLKNNVGKSNIKVSFKK